MSKPDWLLLLEQLEERAILLRLWAPGESHRRLFDVMPYYHPSLGNRGYKEVYRYCTVNERNR